MVESQIRTGGVVDPAVVEAFRAVPRERFAMPGQEGIAYGDEDLPLGAGRWLMEPLTHARLLQAAAPTSADVCLDIGSATGYSSAILSRMTSAVVSLGYHQAYLRRAEYVWSDLGYSNIAAFEGELTEGCEKYGPYSLIVINGAVSYLPPALMAQLTIGGRMVAVVNDRPDCRMGQAHVITRTAAEAYADRVLFDAAVPCLPEFAPRREFVF